MKKFLFTSAALLVTAILSVVATYYYLHTIGFSSDKEISSSENQTVGSAATTEESTVEQEIILSPEQQERLQNSGLPGDVTVTDEIVACGMRVLGEARAAEIAAGSEPTMLEMAKLLSCL